MAITKLRQRGITDQAVGSTQIENSSVAAADIAPATITTTQIAPATIASSNIAPGTVAASNIAPGTITTTQISPAVPLGVPAVSSDPPTPSLSEGDLFFRKDTKTLKCFAIGSAAFSAGTAIPYGASQWSSTGTGSSSFSAICGYGSHPRTGGDNGARGYDHLQFDGTSWTNATNHPYANSGTMCVGTTSALLSGGGHGNPSGPNTPVHPSYSATTISTEWDGSSWGSTASLNYGASSYNQNHGKGGTQTNAFISGGWQGPSSSTKTQNYDGSSWSAGDAMPTTSNWVDAAGPTSDYIIFGGSYGTASALYNGSSWSAGPSLSTSRGEAGRIGTANSPTNTGVLAIGGESPASNTTELYNGTSWASDVALHNAPTFPSSSAGFTAGGDTGGGTSGGIVIGGGSPPYPGSLVAEYTGAALAILSSPATFS